MQYYAEYLWCFGQVPPRSWATAIPRDYLVIEERNFSKNRKPKFLSNCMRRYII